MTRPRLLLIALALVVLQFAGGGGLLTPIGPKAVLIVRESAGSGLGGVLVTLRNDPYFVTAKHTADFLDLDANDKDGHPAPKVAEFTKNYPAVKPPALQIAIPGGRVVYCESLPPSPTAAGIIDTIKANGGGA